MLELGKGLGTWYKEPKCAEQVHGPWHQNELGILQGLQEGYCRSCEVGVGVFKFGGLL